MASRQAGYMRLGLCRRLIFVVNRPDGRRVSLKTLVLPPEALADVTQTLAADVLVPREFALPALRPRTKGQEPNARRAKPPDPKASK
jgi:hypothetical protein